MKRTVLSMLILILSFGTFTPHEADAHPGRLDKLGGHFRNADCTYHLQKPTALGKSAKSKAALVALVKKYSSNSCKNKLTTSKITGSTVSATVSKPVVKPVLKAKYATRLVKCTDGDTATFSINGKQVKTRFLLIDTPESTTKKEPYGKEASAYTCKRLKAAKKITLELDGKDKYDKYDRMLAWVWLDGKLLQEDITKAGLVEDFYDYGTYRYEGRVYNAMKYAKQHNKGMYR
ncbi:thermonuclease family protein [Exiguobacterium flavidum]|uniref:thermonuclease family protein n=1 Tax=Exiguobacterium flavidum TaxID=2184695 RepID=UPI001E4B3951|nr:thermonuclease family protein [Exiguobacterium flavidum]